MAQTLGNVAVGTIIKLNENGSPVEYLVVNQGLPSILYDGSCDGTWLLRKDIIETRVWFSDNINELEDSDIQKWLNDTMLNKYDANLRSAIKQVKIPYRFDCGLGGTNFYGDKGLLCKIFLLSDEEVGLDTAYNPDFPENGSKLNYFERGTSPSAYQKRIANLNGTPYVWWLRSPVTSEKIAVWAIATSGGFQRRDAELLAGVRPALVLPTTLLVLADGSISTAPPAPASISVPDAAMAGNNISVAWETVKGANIYKLERSVNPDGWVTVYTGAGLKYIDKAGDWTSVQYRASAGSTIGTTQYGEPIVSKTVNIVPSTTLRISMPEGNIGEIKGAITYTALSDAPRDAIYISEVFENTYSDYQRELTLKPGDSVTIPVSRFPSAAGGRFTVKAKVQISDNAWANENRQLSYTKTPTSMPDSPYRVERLQGKECDVMPQTLAEAVFMPDGKSVAETIGSPKSVVGKRTGTSPGDGSLATVTISLPFRPKCLIYTQGDTMPSLEGNGYGFVWIDGMSNPIKLLNVDVTITVTDLSWSMQYKSQLNPTIFDNPGRIYTYIAFG